VLQSNRLDQDQTLVAAGVEFGQYLNTAMCLGWPIRSHAKSPGNVTGRTGWVNLWSLCIALEISEYLQRRTERVGIL